MLINLTDKFGGDFKNLRHQCYCGTEYVFSPDSGCPSCGKLVPRAIATEMGPWMTPKQFKVDMLRRMLEPVALEQVPAEFRETMQQNIKRQIRQLEDGSWKAETKQRIHSFRRMLSPAYLDGMPPDEREKMAARMVLHIKRLEEELALAGETIDENAPVEPPHGFGDGIFTRPKVTAREWEEDPMHVAQKVAMAIALHVSYDKMTPPQRLLVYAWSYGQSVSGRGGGHGQILYNRAAKDGPDAETFLEALDSVFTAAHRAVFQKAQAQWDSKPRHYQEPPHGDRAALAAWSKDVFRPLCDEFRDFDKQAAAIEPSLESCLSAFLRQHREEFVEVVNSQ